MSLLLDALKRAEEAKKAQRETEGASVSESSEPLSLAPLDEHAAAFDEARGQQATEPPLMTRNDLPHISQALDIPEEELPPPRRDPAAQRSDRKRPARRAEDDDAFRNAARQLFEAKTPEYDPRKPFYITLGALAVFAVGVVIYFWYQLQPASPARVASPSPSTAVAEVPREIAKAPRPQSSAVTAYTAPRELPVDRDALPLDGASDFDARELRVMKPARAPVTPERDTPSADGPALKRVAVKTTAPSGPSAVEQGYTAYEQRDFVAARTHYEAALERDPLSRDALLGLAALDTRAEQYLSAEARYLRLLEMDPRDPYAHAGMLSLRGQQNPVAAESRIKNLLAQRPDANVLHFSLGNQYATQGRWSEAQQAYFQAYASDPSNPDYAFNLAVSLDQLRQSKLALQYYQKALKLAADRPAAFEASQAEVRVVELSR